MNTRRCLRRAPAGTTASQILKYFLVDPGACIGKISARSATGFHPQSKNCLCRRGNPSGGYRSTFYLSKISVRVHFPVASTALTSLPPGFHFVKHSSDPVKHVGTGSFPSPVPPQRPSDLSFFRSCLRFPTTTIALLLAIRQPSIHGYSEFAAPVLPSLVSTPSCFLPHAQVLGHGMGFSRHSGQRHCPGADRRHTGNGEAQRGSRTR